MDPKNPLRIPIFKGISLSAKGLLWSIVVVVVVAAGVYIAWGLTNDDDDTGQTVDPIDQGAPSETTDPAVRSSEDQTRKQDEEVSEAPTPTTTTAAPAEDQSDEEVSEAPTPTTTTAAPAEDQSDEEVSEAPTPTTTTAAPAEDQSDEEVSEAPTPTTTTAAPVEDQPDEEVSEAPTPTTTTAAPAENQPRPMNSDAWNMGYVLMDMIWDCQFDIQTGECGHIIDGWNAEKIAQEVEAFHGDTSIDCDYDLATESCRGWTDEDFEQFRNESLCGDWYHDVDDMLCYPTPQR